VIGGCYARPAVERSPALSPVAARAAEALRRPANWLQLAKFGAVGASGYVVNLAVYALLLHYGLHFRLAAIVSFVVSAASNYVLNRAWTFREARGHFAYQGMRFLVVSAAALAANQVWLTVLIWLGAGKIVAQAIAIVLVMPLNFVGNKLWSFRGR
jgi:putative flippase GtrA